MGYVDQGCRNINFYKEDTHLWLTAECRKDDGSYRTSKIDLNLCIGPESGKPNGGLEALNGWKVVTLTHGGGEGNYNGFRNWQLANDGRTFKCEKELNPGLKAVLPWNWGDGSDWEWREFNLNEHLNNVNGVLEFWAAKHDSLFPEWLSDTLELAAEAAERAEEFEKPPLAQAIDALTENMVQQKLADLGWEKQEIRWIEGTAIKDWRIIRLGT